MDCGPTCLRMIAKYYGKSFATKKLRDKCYITREGVSLLGISDAAESIGFHTNGVRITFEQLANSIPLPCILHWKQNHFVVCTNIIKKKKKYFVQVADPAHGLITFSKEEFLNCWATSEFEGKSVGSALIIQPTPDFYKDDVLEEETHDIKYFFKYLKPYKKQLIQLIIGILFGSILQLIFPFLTQSIVDTGIAKSNVSFIKLVLIAQMVLFITQFSIEFIRSWLLLHINTRINIALISDFLFKLMKLPLSFFDTRKIGDITQRIKDHKRIESFLTGSSLSTLFSFVMFLVFSCILGYYNLKILGVFLIGNTLYVIWILVFMKYRRAIDYKRFTQSSIEQSNIYQLVTGMQEIKLNNYEKQKRWEWEDIQVRLFKISIKGLVLGQYQQLGSIFFSQITNLLISFLSAKLVIDGNITLGMMMSISYIIGQLSSPISQFIGFAQSLQDAKISLERLGEIHNIKDEDQTKYINQYIPFQDRSIILKDVSFSYDLDRRNNIINNINLVIPHNKTTAIVGASGSGKTTLMKLLLGFYNPNEGEIIIESFPISRINPHLWRRKTGAVMQDGFIFSDSIINNIVLGDNIIDNKRLEYAIRVSNIESYINSLPLGYDTKIGMEGNGLSQGQKQRILIARVVYKNPSFLFFDEATNALDANNEREILENLREFYIGKTVLVIAHRLSTVQHADNIVVIDKGEVIEQGHHNDLIKRKGAYFQLVKNQLELGL